MKNLKDPIKYCSVGIMAHNEEANIHRLLEALLRQNLEGYHIQEIIVVASGCTDNTEALVREFCGQDERIKLLVQEQREGKASAINLFLQEAKADILVLESADTIPSRNAIKNLLKPFSDPRVGMTGARSRPINHLNTFMGYSINFLWWMHHYLALSKPKLGELVAFRNVIKRIPSDTAVDEAALEAILVRAGYQILYVKDAIVRNKGPETIRDYLTQRRRIVAGHKHLYRTQGYAVASTDIRLILSILVKKVYLHLEMILRLIKQRRFHRLTKYLFLHLRRVLYIIGAIFLEILGQGLGAYDFYIKKKNPFIWDVARSTKKI
ncbi:MAG TPA: glycosyltransferase [Candidatus Limnocylindrales bacterium]|nr:glycosyltransferase [Candidatus Limnocylindrales bacterium]